MIDRICLLLEALSIVICLHYLYGEKFKLEIKTIGFLAIDMIIMTAINYFNWPRILTMVIYPILFIYCGLRFGFKIKKMIVNNVLCVIIIGVIQTILLLLCHFILGITIIRRSQVLVVNCIILGLMIMIYKFVEYKNIFFHLYFKSKLVTITLVVMMLLAILWLVSFKGTYILGTYQSIILLLLLCLVGILAAQIGKYKVQAKEIETELRMHELYAESFKALIENVRMRQHEFDNHINTIYSMHVLCNTFDELVEKQQSQCKELEKDNRYNKLLKNDNQIIRGFLYTNFLKAEKFGINVSYEIILTDLDINIPVYRLVEILGNLINNALEAMLENEIEKRLHVSMIEIDKNIEIEVRNTSKFISRNDISKFFEKGYSQKGNNRGLGLYNVKRICDEYGLSICYDDKQIDNMNWLSFMISNKLV